MAQPSPSRQSPTTQWWSWLHRNLFKTWYDGLLTLLCMVLFASAAVPLGQWLWGQAQWAVVQQNFLRLLVGRYPPVQSWRLAVLLLLYLGIGVWAVLPYFRKQSTAQPGSNSPTPLTTGTAWAVILPLLLVVSLWLVGGGWGLANVPNRFWGGLLLTLLIALISILVAFPLSLLLALGRQGQLPVMKAMATLYIELVRGLPLVGILFMAQVMFPLVLPESWQMSLDRLLRAGAGLVLFNAAYLAENVRGGLQAIPRGQIEAARSLGLSTPQTLGLIVLPQAIRIAIPSIVGQFISLFKDTSLLSLFAILELTGMARSILAQPQFLGRYGEVYLFVAAVYWLFCFGMSRLSRKLERSR
jgi:general L-amino acid transport system permease protein